MDNMGQLYQFIAADNAITTFTYIDNTGLLESKETSEGHTFVYEFDENGRLSSVIEPSGELTALSTDVDGESGALARLSTDKHRARVTMATNGNLLSVMHGKWLSVSSSSNILFLYAIFDKNQSSISINHHLESIDVFYKVSFPLRMNIN